MYTDNRNGVINSPHMTTYFFNTDTVNVDVLVEGLASLKQFP
jgi:hypothetical protein